VLSAQAVTGAPAEGRVQFGAAASQYFGLATDLSAAAGNYWAAFSTAGTTNTLYARVNANGAATDVSLGALPAGYHVYRVQPVAGGFQFFIDGALKTTISASIPAGTPLHLALSAQGGPRRTALSADWARLASYPSSGTFTSSVFDATRVATWGVAQWTATLPAGTTLSVQTRSGSTATPDSTWSAWATVTNGGVVASPKARYIQYRVILTTTDPSQTPVLQDIAVNWS
jgi:hypothetical protein